MLSARILRAARDQFAVHGWAGTTLRAVARAADVDPALVYHYFGSKAGLLDAATDPPSRWLDAVAASWTAPIDDLGAVLLRTMLDAWADDEIAPVLRAVLLTAAHDDTTREKLRRIVESSLIGVSRLGADDEDRLRRSALISSQVIGLALMRFVWRVEPVASMSDDELIAAAAPTLQRYAVDPLIDIRR
ncbi:TetR family transcriptional regulator [Mycolicibacterium grossiae]|uniref:TetR family transcriptional regulator n=1 Tax=Mycolicibacterium grossiae TaxID=1552759 RepID=A0A1E8PWP9_9MYCO|nr:TetR family transcriptional regulator [Mycolicibacterium grossiae]